MNDLIAYIKRKGLEKATIYGLKEIIYNDPTLNKDDKTYLMSLLDGISIGKDICDIIAIIMKNAR